MELTFSHILYGLFTMIIILIMIFRKGVVLPTLLGTFLIGAFYSGNAVDGFTAIFNASLVAAQELFHIFLIITFMLGLLHALRDLEADRRMIQPFEKMMVNGHVSFFVLVAVTYVISLFFWPTPAVPLICALLVPAAVKSGLPAMTAAIAIALAGQGMALSSDYIVQVAPGLSAASAGVDPNTVADQSLILSLVTGGIAILLAYMFQRKLIRKKGDIQIEEDVKALQSVTVSRNEVKTKHLSFWSKLFAVFVPIALLGVVVFMAYEKLLSADSEGLVGGEGAALIGGVAVILLLLASVAYGKQYALDYVSNHLTEGFIFAFKAMGPVIPIAGFFFLGSPDFSGRILGIEEHAPAFLFDIVESIQGFLPQSAFLAAFSLLIIGIITGLDGSGFSGLPLTGALAATLENSSIDAATLAAVGQMGAIWTGGGTIVAWSSLIAIAGFCGVSVMDLVRKNFLPVMIGLLVATAVAVFLL